MALPGSLRRAYEPVVDRAIKTGGWGTTTVKHDPTVLSDALFKKAQTELGIANLQADFGLRTAELQSDLMVKTADINSRNAIAMAQLDQSTRQFAAQLDQNARQHAAELELKSRTDLANLQMRQAEFLYEQSLNETSPIERIAAGAHGALMGGITGRNLGGDTASTVAGAFAGAAIGYGGAKAGRQAMATTGGILNDFAQASQQVAGERKQRQASQAMATSMERLGQLNGRLNSVEVMRNPQLAAQIHQERQVALADMYGKAVESGMNPQQAAAWVKHMDETSKVGGDPYDAQGNLKPQARMSAAMAEWEASKKTTEDLRKMQEEMAQAYIDMQHNEGKPVPSDWLETWRALSLGQNLPAGQFEEVFRDPAEKLREEGYAREDYEYERQRKAQIEDREDKQMSEQEKEFLRQQGLDEREIQRRANQIEDREDRQANQRDMQSMRGSGRASGGSRSGGGGGRQKPADVINDEFDLFEQGPMGEKEIKRLAGVINSEAARAAAGGGKAPSITPQMFSQYVNNARQRAGLPPIDVSAMLKGQASAKGPNKGSNAQAPAPNKAPNKRVELKKVAPGQEEMVEVDEAPRRGPAPQAPPMLRRDGPAYDPNDIVGNAMAAPQAPPSKRGTVAPLPGDQFAMMSGIGKNQIPEERMPAKPEKGFRETISDMVGKSNAASRAGSKAAGPLRDAVDGAKQWLGDRKKALDETAEANYYRMHPDDPGRLEYEERKHKERVAEGKLEAAKNQKDAERITRHLKAEREAEFPGVREKREAQVARIEKEADPIIEKMPRNNESDRTKKEALQDKSDALKKINKLVEEVPIDTMTKIIAFAKNEGVGLQSQHLDAKSLDFGAALAAEDAEEQRFPPQVRRKAMELARQMYNLSWADLSYYKSKGSSPKAADVLDNMANGNIIGPYDDYDEISAKLEGLTQDLIDQAENQKSNLAPTEEEKKRGWRRAGKGRIESLPLGF